MSYPVADAHCDFLYRMVNYGYDIKSVKDDQAISLPYMQKGNVALQVFAVWVDRALKTPYLQQCLEMIDAYYRMLDANADIMKPLTKGSRPEAGKILTVLTIEGGEAIEGSLAVLRVLRRLGVSAMTLTWNFNNELACAAMKRSGKGLTSLGKEVVQEMDKLNMALDVSHLNDAGVEDALKIARAPIFASHSNARNVFSTPRALPDEYIREIASRGGVVGVNFFPKQLCAGPEASIDDIVRHILHVLNVGGEDCCALGSDFDGMTKYPIDIPNSGYMQDVLVALEREGLSKETIKKIAFENLHRYIVRFVPEA
ncbi:dipeptidase [Eubacteriales bacterium OttesenSCG-928-K08]|nr:dipeptidase [Eubacteriales bacterium OttesenSCG-928-K08]